MNLLNILLLVVVPIFSTNSTKGDINLDSVRRQFDKFESEDKLLLYIDLCNKTSDPIAEVYKANSYMQRANFTYWPNKKLTYFNNGKNDIQKFIQKYPSSVEARYIRSLVQSSVPSFLGYSSNLKEDCKYILANIDKSDIPNWLQMIIVDRSKTILSKL